MAWYDKKGSDYEYVVSTRVRFARNIADYPFASRMDKTSAQEIIEKVRNAFPDYDYTDFTDLNELSARSYVEKHFVSPNFISAAVPHGLLSKEDRYIMICEEDHLRLQCILPGLALDQAYREASEACDTAEDKLNIAYDDNLGYLTHCPTNLGTGMRASVMMFLPALTMTGTIRKIAAQIAKLGLTIRGLYGEGSSESGCLYQISNQVTLGVSEEDTIDKLKEIVSRIIENEKRTEKALDAQEHDKLCDMSCRALGTLRYATLLTSGEFMDLYGKVRLGLNMGYLKDADYELLDRLSVLVQPASLALNSDAKDADSRDRIRAKIVREEMWKV